MSNNISDEMKKKLKEIWNKRSGSKDAKIARWRLKDTAYVSNEISAIFGLHGLPLPKRSKFVALKSKATVSPASVTPTLIGNTYNASNRRGTVGKASRQAVGEFQGQDALDSDTKPFSSSMFQMPKAVMKNFIR